MPIYSGVWDDLAGGGAAFGLAVAFGFGVRGCAGGVAMHQFPSPLRSRALHLVAVHARPDGDVCPDVSVPKRPFASKGNLASLGQSPVVLKKSADSNRLKSIGSFHRRRGMVASA